jgi:hypothetical protein
MVLTMIPKNDCMIIIFILLIWGHGKLMNEGEHEVPPQHSNTNEVT